jgi:hypothetical protein
MPPIRCFPLLREQDFGSPILAGQEHIRYLLATLLALVHAARHADLRLAGPSVLTEQVKQPPDIAVAQGGVAARVIRPLCLVGFEARRRCSAGLARLLPVIGVCYRQPDQVLVIIDTAHPGGERFGRNAAADERAIGLIEHLA